ncbi:exodeoxyribonuclease III [Maribacter cobaltidurans]|uniref:Exodeoxyribonuclease III n=1 Tax=Maribacter cobaltidurans TaxID=1178778 RepID=A0A223V3Y2_9FLAO|nr:exodeoxyribonuclease III [Maribacter cobaltidurans]ASV30115.1 exodeoxyribonuclease III [Maribacter cobaltidurans]GGD75823.1 exodeoxyribonuclease III [Maribacter cobaltidurans]
MKLVSWNVNGIRASVKKGFEEVVSDFDADVFCFQETKAQDDQVEEALKGITDYELFTNSAEKKGYSGTGILSKQKPISFGSDMGIEDHDMEGRISYAEYDAFYLVNVYVPNSGNGLKRLDYRSGWDKDFTDYLLNLSKKKPLIITGDFNVAHTENDLANPKSNYNKTSGFTQVEIDGFEHMLSTLKVKDSFRTLHPDTFDKYTFWSMRGGARSRNVGWRIDYFLVSESLWPKVKSAEIHDQIMGSDHCPISLEIDI